ncbi:MAG: hypothetical protein Ct9H90mV1_0240 [Prasinovirus sp.]|nr:MAG: hypothetical protein Ct9H90mV1_0240 [Prasinovirus sp.]
MERYFRRICLWKFISKKKGEMGFVCHGHTKKVSTKHVPVRGANNAIIPGKKTQGEYRPIFIYRCGPFSMLEAIEGHIASVKIMQMATLRTERDDPVIIEGSKIKREENLQLHNSKTSSKIRKLYQT